MRHFIVLSVLVLALTPIASPETYVVTPTTLGGIQGVIDIASDGDIIELTDGIFAGDGNRDIMYYGKAITVRSQSGNPHDCIIDCGGSPAEPHRGFLFDDGEGPQSILEGVTITNGYAGRGGGIMTFYSSPTIIGCVLLRNQAVLGGGMDCDDWSQPTLIGCTFVENSAAESGGGMCI